MPEAMPSAPAGAVCDAPEGALQGALQGALGSVTLLMVKVAVGFRHGLHADGRQAPAFLPCQNWLLRKACKDAPAMSEKDGFRQEGKTSRCTERQHFPKPVK